MNGRQGREEWRDGEDAWEIGQKRGEGMKETTPGVVRNGR
jgi:hypothetical protein